MIESFPARSVVVDAAHPRASASAALDVEIVSPEPYRDAATATARALRRGAGGPRIDAARIPIAEWERSASGPWRAPAGLAYAAQRFAQEEMPPGLYFEDYAPAVLAYARAEVPSPSAAIPGLPMWI